MTKNSFTLFYLFFIFCVYVCTELLHKSESLSVGHSKKCLNATILKYYIYITLVLLFPNFSGTLLINDHLSLLTLTSAYKHGLTPCS